MGVKASPYWGTHPKARVSIASLPDGWTSYKMIQRNTDFVYLYIRYLDGIECWAAGLTEADQFVPVHLQSSNRRGKAT